MEPGLTKVERNGLYRSVEEGGLDPATCNLTETYDPGIELRLPPPRRFLRARNPEDGTLVWLGGRGQIAEITHLPSGSIFRIEHPSQHSDYMLQLHRDPYELGTVYSYKSTIAGEQRSSGDSAVPDWEKVLLATRKWAETVKRECVDPDFWTELRRGREFFTEYQDDGSANAPFTSGEQAKVAAQLQEVKEYVKKTYSLSVEQAARVEAKFDEAEDASRRMGRKDWLLLFGGALFSLILSDVVSPEAVQHILIMTAQGLGHLFGHQSPPRLSP